MSSMNRYLVRPPEEIELSDDTISNSLPITEAPQSSTLKYLADRPGLDSAESPYGSGGEYPALPLTTGSQFSRSVGIGVDNIQKTLWGALALTAETFGADRAKDFALSQVAANEAEMQRLPIRQQAFDDISTADEFFTWAASAVGQALPSIGLSFASGGVGGMLGRKALEHKIRDKLLERHTQKMMALGLSRKKAEEASAAYIMGPKAATALRRISQGGAASQFTNRGFSQGATIGVMLGAGVPQMGEAYLNLREAGVFAPGTSFAAGALGGALELLPVARLIDKAFPGVDQAISRGFINDFIQFSGTQSVVEGSTEGLQQVIQLAALAFHDPTFDMLDPDNKNQVIESLAQGALVGLLTGGLGTIAGAATNPGQYKKTKKVDLPQWKLNLQNRLRGRGGEKVELADNTFAEELRGRLTRIAEDTINPAMNAVRNIFQSGIDQVHEASPQLNDEMFRWVDRILAAHNEFVEGHAPVADDISRYVSEYVDYIAKESEAITDPKARADFIERSINEMEQHLKETAEKLSVRGTKVAESLQSTLDGEGVSFDFPDFVGPVRGPRSFSDDYTLSELTGERDRGDDERTLVGSQYEQVDPEEEFGDFAELRQRMDAANRAALDRGDEQQEFLESYQSEGAFTRTEEPGRIAIDKDPEFVFGQTKRREIYRTPKGEKKTTEHITRGKEALPLKERSSAEGLIERLKQRYPSATDSTFQIIETDDGKFLVEMTDVGQRETLIEDETLWEIREAARISTIRRGQKEKDREERQITVKGGRTLDVPTLAYMGKRLGAGDNQTWRDALQTVAGMMYDRGMLTSADWTRMHNKFEAYFSEEEKVMSLRRAQQLDDAGDLAGTEFSNVRRVLKEMRQDASRTAFTPRETLTGSGKKPGEASDYNVLNQGQTKSGYVDQDEIQDIAGQADEPTAAEQQQQIDKEQGEVKFARGRPSKKQVDPILQAKEHIAALDNAIKKWHADKEARESGRAKPISKRAEKREQNRLKSLKEAKDRETVRLQEATRNKLNENLRELERKQKQLIRDEKTLLKDKKTAPKKTEKADEATKANLEKQIQEVRARRKKITEQIKQAKQEIAEAKLPGRKPRQIIGPAKDMQTARNERIESLRKKELEASIHSVQSELSTEIDPEERAELKKDLTELKKKYKKLTGRSYKFEVADPDTILSPTELDAKKKELERLRKAKQFGAKEKAELEELSKKLNEKDQGKTSKHFGEVGEKRAKARVAKLKQQQQDSKRKNIAARIKELEKEIKAHKGRPKAPAKNFTAQEAEELRRLEAGQSTEHISALPKGKTKKALVHMPGAPRQVRHAVAGLVGRASKLLSNKVKLRVLNKTGLETMVDQNHPHAHEAKALLESEYEFAILRRADGVMYIMVDDFSNAGRSLAGLLHELGHAIHYDTWTKLNKSMQNDLWRAFTKDVDEGRTSGRYVNLSPERRGKMPKAKKDIKEFNEWMADQFVAWMNNRRAPRSQLQQFMEAVAQKLDQLWSYIQNNAGRYGQLNETYGEFMDAVAKNIRRRDPEMNNRFFLNEAANGAPLSALMAGEGRVFPIGITEKAWNQIEKRLEKNYPALISRARSMVTQMEGFYSLFIAPSTSKMRQLSEKGITAVDPLIQIFGRDIGSAKSEQNYHQAVKKFKGNFMGRYNDIVKGLSEESKTRIAKNLRKADEQAELRARGKAVKNPVKLTPREKLIQQFFQDVWVYLHLSGLPVGRRIEYFPRVFDREALLKNEKYIMKHLKKKKVNRRDAVTFFNTITTSEAAQDAALAKLKVDELSILSPSFRFMRERVSTDPFWRQFEHNNLDYIVSNYVVSGVKRAEYNKALGEMAEPGLYGGDMLPKRKWNPTKRIDDIIDAAAEQGATIKEQMWIRDYVDANLGRYGRDKVSDSTRRVMASIVAYQNVRVLLFTVFASLPDIAGPAIRSGQMRQSFDSFIKHFKGMNKKKLDLMARAWGIISDAANHHVMTEYVDNHYMPKTFRTMNEGFFKITGLNSFTDFTRKMALAVGIDYVQQQASISMDETKPDKVRRKADRALRELGLTAKQVDTWVKGGEQVWGTTGYNAKEMSREQRRANEAVSDAMVQFVDESILSPNPSQRPLMANHPGFMLVYHLKGYLFAVHETILKRIWFNIDEGVRQSENKGEAALHIGHALAPAIMMMALTAAGIELRELVMGRDRTKRMDGWEYTWTLFERAGLTGIAQLGLDFQGAGARGQNEFAAILGPTIGQLSELISRPPSQTIPKAIPGASQLPWARNMLRDAVGLSPSDRAARKRKAKEREAIAARQEEESQKTAPTTTIYYEEGADTDTQARQIASQLVAMVKENPNYKVSFNASSLGLNNALLGKTMAYFNAFMKHEGLKP